MAASPLPSRGPKRGRNRYVIPAFLGVPKAKRREKIRSASLTPTFPGDQTVELLRNPWFRGGSQRQARGKIRSGCLTLAFAGAQKKAEWLRNPCFRGGSQRQAQGQNHKWLPHPCLLGGPKEGGIAT